MSLSTFSQFSSALALHFAKSSASKQTAEYLFSGVFESFYIMSYFRRMPGGAPQAQPQQQSMVYNGGKQPSYAQQKTTLTTVKQKFGPSGTRETRTETTVLQGPYGGPQTTTVRREERSYGGGPVLQQVGNLQQSTQFQSPTPYQPPSSQQGLGGSQPSYGGSQPSYGGSAPQFKVMDIKGQQMKQSGPSIVSKHVEDGGAITLNIAMSGQPEKENISPQFQPPQFAPQPQFAKPQTWQPTSQPQPEQEYYDEHMSLSQDMMDGPPPPVPLWEGHQPQLRQQEEPLRPYVEMDSGYEPNEQSFEPGMEPESYDVATPKLMPATPGMKPVSLSKLLQESFEEPEPESPSRLRKSKYCID
jgi:hypothetical protein